jgi:hypothetical protein
MIFLAAQFVGTFLWLLLMFWDGCAKTIICAGDLEWVSSIVGWLNIFLLRGIALIKSIELTEQMYHLIQSSFYIQVCTRISFQYLKNQ